MVGMMVMTGSFRGPIGVYVGSEMGSILAIIYPLTQSLYARARTMIVSKMPFY